jgi:hypothetical protein
LVHAVSVAVYLRLYEAGTGGAFVTYENYIKGKLVSFVVEEAFHYGGIAAMMGVAQVLKNRVDAGWHGGDWLGVIKTAPDFTGTTQAAFDFNPRDANFRIVLSQIDDIYHGTADDSNVNFEGEDGKIVSLYYAELHNINRAWFRENIMGNLSHHPRVAQIAQLTFFG